MGFGSSVSIGLEISSDYICAVELLQGSKEAFIKKHGKIETLPLLVNPSLCENNISEPEKLKEAIINLFNSTSISGNPLKEKLRGRHLSLAVPDASAKITLLEFEEIPSERQKILELIKWNLKKTIPFPIEEAVVEYQIMEKPTGANRFYTLLASLMRKTILTQYETILRDINLTPDTIIPSSFAVYNLYHDHISSVPECIVVTAYKKRISVMALKLGKLYFHRNKEIVDEREGLREILVSLYYYHDTFKVMPSNIYLLNCGFETIDLKTEIESHCKIEDVNTDGSLQAMAEKESDNFVMTDKTCNLVRPIGIGEVLKGSDFSMNILSGAAGAAI